MTVRFLHPDGTTVHLGYCSNVHPAEEVDGIVAQLARFAGPVRRRLGAALLGVGLWLPARAAAQLALDARELDRLRHTLDDQGLEVVTLNGFPFGGFHAPVVGRAVYRPGWADPRRLAYTLDLARVLAGLLPDGVEAGSISTVPLGWRAGWSEAHGATALDALTRLATGLERLRDRTGRTVRVGLEPEPGCVLESADQASAWLASFRAGAGPAGTGPAGTGPAGAGLVGACLDACHLAVGFEDPGSALATLGAAGVPVVKAQASSALRVPSPGSAAARATLGRFVEPRYLHQVRERGPGTVVGVDDLPEALAGGLPATGEWRVHHHVPVHWNAATATATTAAADPGRRGTADNAAAVTVGTTQGELGRFLEELLGGPEAGTAHVEVETYTWAALPPGDRPRDEAGLVDGLARELRWAADRLRNLGLKEQQ